MDLFQNSFEKLLNENITLETILKKVINNKYEEIGIKLKQDKLQEVVADWVAKIESSKGEFVTFNIEDNELIESRLDSGNTNLNSPNI